MLYNIGVILCLNSFFNIFATPFRPLLWRKSSRQGVPYVYFYM